MAGGTSSQARQALSVIRRLVNSSWISLSSSSSSVANHVGSRNCASAAAAAAPPATGGDTFWVVEGDILRIKSEHQTKSLMKVVGRNPPSENLNLSKKKIAHTRLQRVMAVRMPKSEGFVRKRGQEDYWRAYFVRLQNVRDHWEKLYWDGVPEEKPAPVIADKNDPFTILGLKRRDTPYSPVELKSAYREMALKYHPDHNPGKDAEVRFEKIWKAYKMLQHKRSWR